MTTLRKNIPYLSEADLSALDISTVEVIASVEDLIRRIENQTAWTAPKAVILPGDGRYLMATLAAADESSLLAVKTLVLNPGNPERNLPQINGLVTMLDASTGLPLALLDGNWITAVRTAGLSATAAKHMARQESSVAAFVGCGLQARSHLQAFAELFPIEEVRLFGRGKPNIEKMCEQAHTLSLDVKVCGSGEEAISDADLVVTSVTYAANLLPFLDAKHLKPGSFSTVTDLAAPWHKESFVALDQVVVDDLHQENSLPNKLVPPECLTGDLSGLVLGKFAGRERSSDRNAFVFRGHAIGDLALSVLAYQRAFKH